jgi:hypothetical protein
MRRVGPFAFGQRAIEESSSDTLYLGSAAKMARHARLLPDAGEANEKPRRAAGLGAIRYLAGWLSFQMKRAHNDRRCRVALLAGRRLRVIHGDTKTHAANEVNYAPLAAPGFPPDFSACSRVETHLACSCEMSPSIRSANTTLACSCPE